MQRNNSAIKCYRQVVSHVNPILYALDGSINRLSIDYNMAMTCSVFPMGYYTQCGCQLKLDCKLGRISVC